MCKYCNFNEQSGIKEVTTKKVGFKVGKKTVMRHTLQVCIKRDEDGCHDLRTDYYTESELVARSDISIQYCPFCGEKLK